VIFAQVNWWAAEIWAFELRQTIGAGPKFSLAYDR